MTNSGLQQQQQQQQRIRYTMAPDDGDDESPPAATSCAVKVIEPSPGNTTTGGGGAAMSNGQQQQQQQQQQQHLRRARQWLFLAHFAAQFSQNAWQFALVFFLYAFSNYQSLLLISTYGLISQMSIFLFGASSGSWVDRGRGAGSVSRLYVARCFVWIQKSGVLVATALCYLLLKKMQQQQPPTAAIMATEAITAQPETTSWLEREFHGIPLDPISIALLVGIHVFGSLEAVLDKAFLVLIEREWVVIMSQVAANNVDDTAAAAAGDTTTVVATASAAVGEPNRTSWLSETNVVMKQISLGCQVVAPAVTVFVVGVFDSTSTSSSNSSAAATSSSNDADGHAHGDLSVAAILVAAFNVASLAVEYICTARIYRLVPPLRDDRGAGASTSSAARAREESSSLLAEKKMDLHHHLQIETASEEKATTSSRRFCCIPSGLKTYFSQPISMAGLGLSLLYLNVLSFGDVMTGYLVWRGMRLETVSIWRGVSAAMGLVGTVVYHFCSSRNISLFSTGMWSVAAQFSCLSICFLSLFMTENYNVSMVMLIAGTCASRVGLYLFDITVTQLMQEFIPDGIRGVVGGTQQSLNALLFLMSFAIGIAVPDPQEFNIYVSTGYVAVGLAMLLYMFGIYRKRELFLRYTWIEQGQVQPEQPSRRIVEGTASYQGCYIQ